MFFFFKQKTAYEMRISDWSSDVCSSDLLVIIEDALARYLDPPGMPVDPHNLATKPQLDIAFLIKAGMAQWQTADVSRDLERPLAQGGPTIRSDEHTSELQSRMRIPYAGFCLKKKIITHICNTAIAINYHTHID